MMCHGHLRTYCHQSVCQYHSLVNVEGAKGSHSDCEGPQCNEGEKFADYKMLCHGSLRTCEYCNQSVCKYHAPVNTKGVKGGHRDCEGPQRAFTTIWGHLGPSGPTGHMRPNGTIERMMECLAECWNASSTTSGRDASCAENLVCAREEHEGRAFGDCPDIHCCSASTTTSLGNANLA